ncbi:hypothetical protein FRC08_009679 [Ceratobasidium sp. 394]|nr:hypothetical protein FRC08_009679 [Ceratobasidium sp. 394]
MRPSGDRADVSPTAIHAIHAPPSCSRLPITSRQRPLAFWRRRHAQVRPALNASTPAADRSPPVPASCPRLAIQAAAMPPPAPTAVVSTTNRPFPVLPYRLLAPRPSSGPGLVISEWLRRHEASRHEKDLDGSGQQRGHDTSVAGEPDAMDAAKSGGSVGRAAQHAGVEADVGERVVPAGERRSGKRDDGRTGTV